MLPRFGMAGRSTLLVALTPIPGINTALAEEKTLPPLCCNNATLKGTYLYSSVGVLDGKSYAESGREVYGGKGGVALTVSGTGGAAGTMQARSSVGPDCTGKALYPYGQSLVSFISPDDRRFSSTITHGPGDRPTALSGWEIRVAP